MPEYFSIHEEGYRKYREKGKFGWYSREAQAEHCAVYAEMLESGHVPRKGRLLEMGCGDGEKSMWFASRGYLVTGVDLSPAAITWAKDKAKDRGLDVAFLVDDVLELGTQEDESFDLVLDGHCLHCIVGDGRRMFLAAAMRVLKPGGFFRVESMCQPLQDPDVNVKLPFAYDHVLRRLFLNDDPYRHIGYPDGILGEIKQAGFRIVKYEEVEARPERDDEWTDGIRVDAVKPIAKAS